jgi:hypothetical protein
MRTRKLRARLVSLAALAALVTGPGCATGHLLRWSEGKPSIFAQPFKEHAPYVHPTGVILGLPITVVWDVVTWPVQWLSDVYPYGVTLDPATSGKEGGYQ